MSTAFLYGSRVAGDHGPFHQKQCGYCPRLLPAGSIRTYCADCEFIQNIPEKPDFTFGAKCVNEKVAPYRAYSILRCRCTTRCMPWWEAEKAKRRARAEARRG